MRKFVTLLAAFAAVAAVPTAATAAPAGPSGSHRGASFAVSAPAEPLRAGTDGVVHTVMTVANNGQQALVISLRSARVRALDDGKTGIVDEPDARWSSLTNLPPQVQLAPAEYRRVPVTIRVPSDLLPDLYLLGFVAEATPLKPTSDAVMVHNQIVPLITIEVPGARERHLQVRLDDLPFVHLGSTLTGAFRVTNVGEAAAMTRGQVRLDNAVGGENIGVVQVSAGRELLPAATSRHQVFKYETHDWYLLVRPSVEVSYGNGTSAMNAASARGSTTLVLPWRTVILLALLLCAGLAYALIWYGRRLRSRRSGPATRNHRPAGRRRARRREESQETSPRTVAPA